jgi:predicted NAD/FAD-binding protein
MSIQDEASGIAYAGGRGLPGFLASPRQLLDRDYLTMLGAVRRFHREATRFLAEARADDDTTYGDFIADVGLPASFTTLYAVPLVACVWSTEVGRALDYPARHLFAFLRNHGMLSIGDSPQWFTVQGGSRTYVDALAARLPDVRVARPVRSLTRHDDGVDVIDAAGRSESFDRVVVATHSDTALALLADATPAEKEVLGAIRYTPNETVLHSDTSLLPATRRLRSSWNYLMPVGAGSGLPIVTYWMNKLQGLPAQDPLLVTLNATERIDPTKVIATMHYSHPLFDVAAIRAQRRLPELTTARTTFAGAYHGWGFHEDGARSGVAAAEAFGVTW